MAAIFLRAYIWSTTVLHDSAGMAGGLSHILISTHAHTTQQILQTLRLQHIASFPGSPPPPPPPNKRMKEGSLIRKISSSLLDGGQWPAIILSGGVRATIKGAT